MYRLNDIYPTVQGEGVHTGVPMVLVRLHGCPVGCPFCDTKETWDVLPEMQVNTLTDALGANSHWVEISADAIMNYARQIAPQTRWIMLTGGEPGMQLLHALIESAHAHEFKVALETSGTATGHLGAGVDWVCVSPKINMPGKRLLNGFAIQSADEIKMVIGKQADIDQLDRLLAVYSTKKDVIICLQPMSASRRATALCMKTCLQRGWRLSIQTHKLINIR